MKTDYLSCIRVCVCVCVRACVRCRCTCLQWQNVSARSAVVRRAANEVISVINRLTEKRSSQCARLSVGDVTSASRYVAGSDLLRFRQSSDIHGRTADLSDNMQPTVVSITLQLMDCG